jgi:RNA polymerase sigma-70 factor (ECF subfamily)
MEVDQADLVRRTLEGDREAFVEMIRAHERLVGRIVARMVRDPRDREELCQDVFLRVHRGLSRFRAEATLATWIARIAYRACLNHLRVRDPHRYENEAETGSGDAAAAVLLAAPTPAPGPADQAASGELRRTVREAVDTLPPAYRALVTLHHLEGFSVREVAEVMELPEGTVKVYLSRARRQLRAWLLARHSEDDLRP